MTPLTLEDLHARLADRSPGERLDLGGYLLEDLDLRGVTLTDVDLGHRGRAASVLRRVRFEGATLHGCAFTGVRFEDVAFQRATLDGCDLRYADLTRTSFKEAQLLDCDLYRSRLGPGTVLEGADLSRCSLYLALLDGAVLPRSAITEGASTQLLQERADDFAAYHARLEALGRSDGRAALHLARRHREAAAIHRALAGHWTSTGASRDAGWAYVRAKRLETAAANPLTVARRRRVERELDGAASGVGPVRATVPWLGGLLAWWTAGFGERPLRVLATAVVWVLLMGTVLHARQVGGGGTEAYLLSLQALSTTLPDLDLGRIDRGLLSLVTIGGVTLLGLLGFTLGNRLRNA